MSFFQLPLWLKGLNSSTGTDKLLAVKDNGEVTKSNKTLDEIGLTPSLQDVLEEDNTAVTEGNWQFGSNRTRITSNNGVYVQNTNNQARLKTNGVIFRDISTNDSIEINFAGSTGTHAQVLQDKAGTIALTSDIPVTSNFVPYTGAAANVDLGSRQLTTTGNITGGASYSLGLSPTVNFNRTSDSKNLTIIQDAAQTKNHVTLTAPSDKNGTIAVTSELPTEWSTYTGTRLGADLLLKIGDFDSSGNGTKIEINDDEEQVQITSSSGVLINGNQYAFENVSSGTVPVIRTMNSAAAQSTTLLNGLFPTAVTGTTVVNINNAQRYIYTKISAALWRQSALMTDI